MASQALATSRDENPIAQISNQLTERAGEFRKVLPSHISPDKFQRTVITAVQTDPDLLLADRRSLMLACMKAAQDGLLPDKREAALVIFVENKKIDGEWVKTKKVAYLPMVYGLRKKVLQSGEITDITAKVVYRREAEEGFFIYEEGTEATLRHKPILNLTSEEASDENIVAVYSMATFNDGTKSYEVMRRFEVDKVRETSQTGAMRDRKGQARTPSGPWVEWYPEQAKKTAIRRHTKTLPMSGDLVDVEVMDEMLAARSTAQVLSIADPTPPKRLEADASQGLTNVDEETARQLDRETEARAAGADTETGEIKEEPEPEKKLEPEKADAKKDAPPIWQRAVDAWKERIANASIIGDVLTVESELEEVRDELPKLVAKDLDALIDEAKAQDWSGQ